jgi:hypothetical protein
MSIFSKIESAIVNAVVGSKSVESEIGGALYSALPEPEQLAVKEGIEGLEWVYNTVAAMYPTDSRLATVKTIINDLALVVGVPEIAEPVSPTA